MFGFVECDVHDGTCGCSFVCFLNCEMFSDIRWGMSSQGTCHTEDIHVVLLCIIIIYTADKALKKKCEFIHIILYLKHWDENIVIDFFSDRKQP